MQEQAVPVVTHGVKAIQLDVQHVGEPRHRMPIVGMVTCECPDKVFEAEPGIHMDVSGDVIVVVKIDEIIELQIPKTPECDRDEDD